MDKPKIECVETHQTADGLTYSKFVAEPLDRGYGTTLGNALRRVLLSDIEGAAITAIRIEGVPHEFTTIPGVVEDVVDIILNLKGVVLKLHSGDLKTAHISAHQEGVVTAGQMVADADVEIINLDWPIATLDAGASIEVELQIEKGKGFVTAERNRKPHQAVGVIPIDAIFMPIRKVNYTVEDTRVGQMTDFDRLILELWTNGAIEPNEAISRAADTLIKQFDFFADLAREAIGGGLKVAKEEALRPQPTDMSIEELELSVRAYNCLKRANIYTVGDLLKKTERELMDIKNFGKKSAEEVIERLRAYGFHMASGEPIEEYTASALQEE
ncbi:MAG: DNA-directed RNA polymerase subunit alpha [Cyanobacteria bacterium NC_groundwater_1444_Ag_S-0.65um_54_12]|nr:DNA-directed RNA polymerase subunit alpha [Cyanobacteria bacterium NC_groundwater_1444_Ag_S-0.65um_54_12]